MGNFLDLIQKEQITSPTRRNFNTKTWKKEYEQHRQDELDENIFNAGNLIHSKFSSIRSNLTITNQPDISKRLKLLTMVAVANQSLAAIEIQTHEEFSKKNTGEFVFAQELIATKLKTKLGTYFSPEELLESLVDGLELPIKVALLNNENHAVKSELPDNYIDHAIIDINLGILYKITESIWEECTWNQFEICKADETVHFQPGKSSWHDFYVISSTRQKNLDMQFFSMAQSLCTGSARKSFFETQKIPLITAITKQKKNQIYTIKKVSLTSATANKLLILKSFIEPYYQELLNEKLPLLKGGSINDLINCLGILQSVAQIKLESIKEQVRSQQSDSLENIDFYSAKLQRNTLINATFKALNLPIEIIDSILTFLTYKGESEQELWSQPIVMVEPGVLVPVLGSLIHTNVKRTLDLWLKQLKVDLGRRGQLFEKHINDSISKEIKESILSGHVTGLPSGLLFSPSKGRSEQIDTVIIFDDVVVLGESKCIKSPTEAKEVARHRETVLDATKQITRKAISVETNRIEFVQHLGKQGIKVNPDFKIQPIVILNNSIHVGKCINNVPIVDEYLLSNFFKGSTDDVALIGPETNGAQVLKKTVFFTSPKEAAEYFSSYVSNPPILKGYFNGLNSRAIILPKVESCDWEGVFNTFECFFKLEKLSK